MSYLNTHYATSSSANWKKIIFDILKYALGAVLGGVGVAASGCASIPVFNF